MLRRATYWPSVLSALSLGTELSSTPSSAAPWPLALQGEENTSWVLKKNWIEHCLSIRLEFKSSACPRGKELIIHKHKYLTVGPWVESYTTFNECVKLADSSALHKLNTENSSDRPAVPLNISHSLCQLSWHKIGRKKRVRIEQERVKEV